MSIRPSPCIAVQQLEPRDVPAAHVLADIRPGQWGSFPRDFTAAGERVYFAATSVQGEELWVTDGTAAGTKLTRDIRPRSFGSNPRSFTPAGNGVLYFTADDGTGRGWWRTDGTTTTKVVGLPANVMLTPNGQADATGLADGSLLVTAFNHTQLWWTDGTTARLLKSSASRMFFIPDGKVGDTATFRLYGPNGHIGFAVHETDGTAEGTREVAPLLSTSWQARGWAYLSPLARLAGDRYVAHARYADGASELRVVSAAGVGARLIAEPPVVDRTGYSQAAIPGTMWSVDNGNHVLFLRLDPATRRAELWHTDGTARNTEPVLLPGHYDPVVAPPTAVGEELVVGFRTAEGQTGLARTRGGETTTLLAPDGSPATGLVGVLPASTRHPTGLMVLKAGNRLYASTGAGGADTFWLDTAGVPTKAFTNPQWHPAYWTDPYSGQGVAMTGGPVATNGRVFFATPWAADSLPEPAAWDLLAGNTTPPPSPAPRVAGVSVNDGERQRSMVTKTTVAFDQVVTLEAGAITARNLGNLSPVDVQVMTAVVDGRTVATVTFSNWDVVGGSLPDGVYQLTVNGAKVKNASGSTMVGERTETFHRLFGDLDGDRTFDRSARSQIVPLLGTTRGSAAYLAAFDFDANGVIEKSDELQIIRRWGTVV
jgi:ELWxxDGT repeat protein